MVDRMTDANGAAAETQNRFGFLMLCIHPWNSNRHKWVEQNFDKQAMNYADHSHLQFALLSATTPENQLP